MAFFVTMPAHGGGYWIRFDYNETLIARLKELPVDCRRWEPEMRAWWVHTAWISTAKALLTDQATYEDRRRCRNHWRPDNPEEERQKQREDREETERERERRRKAEDESRRREQEAKYQQYQDWARQNFGGSGGSGASHERRTGDRASGDCFAKLYLLSSAPPGVVTAAWKALCRVHHPDVGGSTERMKEINLAYEVALKIAERAGK